MNDRFLQHLRTGRFAAHKAGTICEVARSRSRPCCSPDNYSSSGDSQPPGLGKKLAPVESRLAILFAELHFHPKVLREFRTLSFVLLAETVLPN